MKKLLEELKHVLEDNSQKIEERVEASYYYRGKLISVFSGLENSIEIFLAYYLMGKPPQFPYNRKHVQLRNVILERMTFEAKRTSMKAFTDDLSISKGFKKTRSNKYPNHALFDEIRKLNEYRVYFAHYSDETHTNKEGLLDYVIALNERRERNQIRKFSLNEFDEIIDRIKKATKLVDDLTLSIINDSLK